MKAMHIMMFLLIFNMSISIVSATNIYNMNYEQKGIVTDTFDENISSEEQANAVKTKSLTRFFLVNAGVFTLSMAVGTIAGLSDKFVGSGVSGLDAFLYSLFTGLFLTTTADSASIFLSIGKGNYGILLVVIAFILITSVVFTLALYQIASKGGWRSFE